MTPEEIEKLGKLIWGQTWRASLIEESGLSRAHLFRIMKGEYPLPEGIQMFMARVVAERQVQLAEWAGRLARR